MKLPLRLAIAFALSGVSLNVIAQESNPFAPPPPPPKVEAPIVEAAPEPEPIEIPEPEPKPLQLREEVSAKRVGVVNGKFLYKGDNTYVFDDMAGRKLIRVVGGSNDSDDSNAYAESSQRLPSSVGSAAPRESSQQRTRANPSR